MRATIPGRAYLQDMERFLRGLSDDEGQDFIVDFSQRFFSLHPLAICMMAALGERARLAGQSVGAVNLSATPSTRYLKRMGLLEALDIDVGFDVREHDPSGRFVPLRRITSNSELNSFVLDVGPLLHASPDATKSVKYVLYELIRNVLEHAGGGSTAFVCAQVPKDGRLMLGVADCGIGIRRSMARSHPVPTDESAIEMALRPGVSGTTRKFGGNETNGGAGLFFMKSMAIKSRNFMNVISGDTLMKLLISKSGKLNARLAGDRVKWWTLPATYPGTAVGIDLSGKPESGYEALLTEIRSVYRLSVKESKKARYKGQFS